MKSKFSAVQAVSYFLHQYSLATIDYFSHTNCSTQPTFEFLEFFL